MKPYAMYNLWLDPQTKICFVENWRNLNIDPLLDIIESILSFLDGLVDYLHSWEIYALGDVYRRKV